MSMSPNWARPSSRARVGGGAGGGGAFVLSELSTSGNARGSDGGDGCRSARSGSAPRGGSQVQAESKAQRYGAAPSLPERSQTPALSPHPPLSRPGSPPVGAPHMPAEWLRQRIERAQRVSLFGASRSDRLDEARDRVWGEAFEQVVVQEVQRCRSEDQADAEQELERLRMEHSYVTSERDGLFTALSTEQKKTEDLTVSLRKEAKQQREAAEVVKSSQSATKGLQEKINALQRRLAETEELVAKEREKTRTMSLQIRREDKKARQEQANRLEVEQQLRDEREKMREAKVRQQQFETQLSEERRSRENVERKLQGVQEQLQEALQRVRNEHHAKQAATQRLDDEASRGRQLLSQLQEERKAREKAVMQKAEADIAREALLRQKDDIMHERNALRGDLVQVEEDLSAAVARGDELDSEVKRLEQVIAEMQGQVQSLEEEERQRSQLVEDQAGEIRSLRDELEGKSSDSARMREEMKVLREQLVSTRDELTKATGTIIEKERIIDDLEEFKRNAVIDLPKVRIWLDEEMDRFHEKLAGAVFERARAQLKDLEEFLWSIQKAFEGARRALKAATERPPEDNPACWGLTVGQLLEFYGNIRDDLESYCEGHSLQCEDGVFAHVCHTDPCPLDHMGIHHLCRRETKRAGLRPLAPTMHVVNHRYIKPVIGQKSYALKCNPGGRRVDVFVTHSWNGLFNEFVGTLEMALKKSEAVWVCSFAVPQNRNIAALLGDDPSKSPFALALYEAKKHVVLLDTQLDVPERAWCVYELALSLQNNLPLMPWFYAVTDYDGLVARVTNLDLRQAKASVEADRAMIEMSVETLLGGYDQLNTTVRDSFIERLKFYGTMVKNHGVELQELQRQLELAREERDQSRIKELELKRLKLSSNIGHQAETDAAEEDHRKFQEEMEKAEKNTRIEDRLIKQINLLDPQLAHMVQSTFTAKEEEILNTTALMRAKENEHEKATEKQRRSSLQTLAELDELKRVYRAIKTHNDDLSNDIDAKAKLLENSKKSAMKKVMMMNRLTRKDSAGSANSGGGGDQSVFGDQSAPEYSPSPDEQSAQEGSADFASSDEEGSRTSSKNSSKPQPPPEVSPSPPPTVADAPEPPPAEDADAPPLPLEPLLEISPPESPRTPSSPKERKKRSPREGTQKRISRIVEVEDISADDETGSKSDAGFHSELSQETAAASGANGASGSSGSTARERGLAAAAGAFKRTLGRRKSSTASQKK
eukprot:TRINITY_DN3040_c0_g1_i1.p1 TRINITY_DN3040_c0_g1~~TRINITY_DN3040_c0_g1_i1.p1  ORF type:complete len:1225 (+),score=342.48 TRINITY_DN3040_c0_g1_i1:149-3823(+)